MKVYIVISENGEYSDYTMENIVVFSELDQAKELLSAIEAARNLWLEFSTKLNSWKNNYEQENPYPAFPVKPNHAPQPTPPAHLSGLGKKDKQEYPEYKFFLSCLKKWQSEHNAVLDAYRKKEKEHNEQYWNRSEKMKQAEQEFIANDGIITRMKNCFHSDMANFANLAQDINARYSIQEIELM